MGNSDSSTGTKVPAKTSNTISKRVRKQLRKKLRKALRRYIKRSDTSTKSLAKQLGIDEMSVIHLRDKKRRKEFSVKRLAALIERTGQKISVCIEIKTTAPKDTAPNTAQPTPTHASGSSRKKSVSKRTNTKKTRSRKSTTRKSVASKLAPDTTSPGTLDVRKRRNKAVRKKTTKRTSTAALFKTPAGSKDNLQRIKGVGPAMERVLNRLGITRYNQIAKLKATQITQVNEALGRFSGRIQRDSWIRQAKVLAAGRSTAFSKRVDKGSVASSSSR